MKKIAIGMLLLTYLTSCEKEWLNEKPQQSLVIFNSVSDVQALLNNTLRFNVDHPSRGEDGCDNHFLMDNDFQNSIGQDDRNVYAWARTQNFYGIPSIADWNGPYMAIFNANVGLEALDKIKESPNINIGEWSKARGIALFLRAYSHYNLAQIFCKPYMSATSNGDLGLILRLQSDINVKSTRSTVQASYDQILQDLLEAKNLLPVNVPEYKTQPYRNAAYAMLARVYLAMNDYENALLYSDSCLDNSHSLLEFDQLDSGIRYPFTRYNSEVLFHSFLRFSFVQPARSTYGHVDTNLYNSYHSDDLRGARYFDVRSGRRYFRGSYNGDASFFSGLAFDEIYFIRAECNARLGDVQSALDDLNNLLVTRWRPGTFSPFTAADQEEALQLILVERRKELCFRGLRWTDLRRLNQESKFATTITRNIGGVDYTLLPSEMDRYVLPIPDNEVLYSAVPQNPR